METFLLGGAPDGALSSPNERAAAVQVMHLEMSNDVLDELLDCVRKGKAPQVLFSKTPLIRYDGKTHELHTKPEKFRCELYRVDQENEPKNWEFSGLINHSLAIQSVDEASASTDRALATLKNTMASIEQEREARKVAISTPEVHPMKAMSKAQSRATHLKPLLASNSKSNPASPALGASTPSNGRLPPTSAGLEMPFDVAIRKALVHYLAVQPRPYLTCRRAVHTNPRRVLDKVAKLTGKGEEEYALLDRAYKELDVWKFKYSEEDRQAAVENAIHAYDRMRLPKDDPLWQKLLPFTERGKGKVLSRLALKDPAKGTPALKAQTFDKKTGLPKRKDAKKQEKDSTRVKKAKDGVADEKPRATKAAAEGRTPKVEAGKERQPNKRTAAATEDGPSSARKEAKPSAAAKGLLNKPKNLSPLGASPPVNASDFENGHPVHKRLSAATSPRAGAKRKADEINGASHRVNGMNKRPHLGSTSTSSSEERPLKASKIKSSSGPNGVHGRTNGHISSDSDSSSGNSPPLALSWRQSLEMARKFNLYYQQYKKLYMELSQSTEPPTEKKREELLEMHRRLEKMKREVNNGAL